MTLFGTDGIRGRYGESPLNDSSIRKIGLAISRSFNDNSIKKVYIAHDGRESCESILRNLIMGICSDRSYEIIYLDLFPTPALTYLLSENDLSDAIGIEITASHNPYHDNGIKIFDKLGYKIKIDQEVEIENIVYEQIDIKNTTNPNISSNNLSRNIYIDFISKLISKHAKTLHKLNIAVDSANGAMSNVITAVKWPDNISITMFNNSPNGKNINQQCGAVYPEYLSSVISKHNKNNDSNYIDFGVCLDGDGDRALIIDSSGNILDGDDLLYLFALHSKGNKRIVGTVMTNYGIRDGLEKEGFDFFETDVGDKNVLESILNNKAYIGAESSGHIIHTDTARIPIGDGLVTMIKFIHLLLDANKSIDEIYPISLKIPSKLINIDSSSQNDFLKKNQLIISKVEEKLNNDGRIFIRKSGTQSLIRILIEHKSIHVLNDAEKLIKSIK